MTTAITGPHDFIPSATFDGSRGRYCIECCRTEAEHLVAPAPELAPPTRYVVVDGVHRGTIVGPEDAHECLFCGSLDSECRTCHGGYVLGWDDNDRPTGRLEPVR